MRSCLLIALGSGAACADGGESRAELEMEAGSLAGDAGPGSPRDAGGPLDGSSPLIDAAHELDATVPPPQQVADCSLVGCPSGVAFTLPTTASWSEIQSWSLTLCRNDDCVVTPLRGLPAEPEADSGVALELPDGIVVRDGGAPHYLWVNLWTQRDGQRRLEVRHEAAPPAELRDGERVRLQVTRADGGVLLGYDEPARYEERRPNGPSCGPVCRLQKVELTGL